MMHPRQRLARITDWITLHRDSPQEKRCVALPRQRRRQRHRQQPTAKQLRMEDQGNGGEDEEEWKKERMRERERERGVGNWLVVVSLHLSHLTPPLGWPPYLGPKPLNHTERSGRACSFGLLESILPLLGSSTTLQRGCIRPSTSHGLLVAPGFGRTLASICSSPPLPLLFFYEHETREFRWIKLSPSPSNISKNRVEDAFFRLIFFAKESEHYCCFGCYFCRCSGFSFSHRFRVCPHAFMSIYIFCNKFCLVLRSSNRHGSSWLSHTSGITVLVRDEWLVVSSDD